MAWVYILQGTSGKFYIGSTDDLPRRLEQHQAGHTPSTVRLGLPVVLVASKVYPSLKEAWVYILQGSSGKFYIGSTDDLPRRLEQHQAGHTPSTVRLGLPVALIASKVYPSLKEARDVERLLKSWKKSSKALTFLQS